MRKLTGMICGLALVLFCTATPAAADVPTQMNVQGRLTAAGGGPVPAGFKDFTFKIFDQQSGGVEIWPAGPGEIQSLATDANGLWSGSVGKIFPLTEAVFQSPARWLEVTVDDGVNPPETLPRVELKTNPYTYRAASSQKADTLGGLSLSDIMDTFVNETADTMSGQLRIDWANTDVGPLLEVVNINNGDTSVWDQMSATWGATVEAYADNSDLNVGLGGAAQGENSTNLGVYGVGSGAGVLNVGLVGIAMEGSKNYGGYFFGDIMVDNSWGGDSSVWLPQNAISADEILDEPGIAQGRNAGSELLSSNTDALTTVTSVVLSIPVDGYVHLHGHCFLEFSGGTDGHAFMQINDAPNLGLSGGMYSLSTGLSLTQHYLDVSTDRVYFKPAGTHEFYLMGAENCTGTVEAGYAALTATFYPRAYGTVSTVVDAADIGEYEHAVAADVGSAGISSHSLAKVYDVDLRELELRAARAQAEAERARRELVEAQLRTMRRPSPSQPVDAEEPRP